MLRARLLTAPLAGLALLGLAGAPSGPDAAITSAAVAPYRDALLRDAPALCSDLAPKAAAKVVPGTPPGTSCEQAVQQIFAAAASPRVPRAVARSLRANASHLKVSGRHAAGTFLLTASETTKRHGRTTVVIRLLGTFRLSLEELAGRWLASSQARLTAIPDCLLHRSGRCRPGTEDPIFTLGEPVGFTPEASIPIPPALPRLPQDRRDRQPGTRREPHLRRRTALPPRDRSGAGHAPRADAVVQAPARRPDARPHPLPLAAAVSGASGRCFPPRKQGQIRASVKLGQAQYQARDRRTCSYAVSSSERSFLNPSRIRPLTVPRGRASRVEISSWVRLSKKPSWITSRCAGGSVRQTNRYGGRKEKSRKLREDHRSRWAPPSVCIDSSLQGPCRKPYRALVFVIHD
jgi:hypothetical protein